jgi:Zinc carboxypeptidase
VDGNRNFGYNWMELGGASSDPCSNGYAGPEPYSEPEIRALVDYYVTIVDKIDLYLSFHSYGQYFLIPYGTGIRAPNFRHLQLIGEEAADALRRSEGTVYTVGNTAEVLCKIFEIVAVP